MTQDSLPSQTELAMILTSYRNTDASYAIVHHLCGLVEQYAALARDHSRDVPEGWKLVPAEPTREMLKIASDLEDRCAVQNYGGSPTAEAIYDAMISAAPLPSSQGGGKP